MKLRIKEKINKRFFLKIIAKLQRFDRENQQLYMEFIRIPYK
jgi:hypothetical protein